MFGASPQIEVGSQSRASTGNEDINNVIIETETLAATDVEAGED